MMRLFKIMPVLAVSCALALGACNAPVEVPDKRNVSVNSPQPPHARPTAVNEHREPILYVPLGEDVLVPERVENDPLPGDLVGPFELRGETLAGALQLILADYNIPLAFETEEGLSRRITVANMHGWLPEVVEKICGFADLYCAYEDGVMVVKEVETFTVQLPPIGADANGLQNIVSGLTAVTGLEGTLDLTTSTLIYTASHRTAKRAKKYFDTMRRNTALIVFETHIWEVNLDSANRTGIQWQNLDTFGKFNLGLNLPGGVSSTGAAPISIGLPTTGNVDFAAGNIFQFISEYGAVKTISQPQLTMLSGTQASLRVAQTRNFISQIERTTDNDGDTTFSTETDTVDTGLELTVTSNWDRATVYGTIEIEIEEFIQFDEFDAGDGQELRLPQTTQRELETQIRVRPGDSVLIAGLVTQRDDFSSSGPGFMKPLFPLARNASTQNSELVFLIRPRVVVYTDAFDDLEVEGQGEDKAPAGDKGGPALSEDVLSGMFVDTAGDLPMGSLSADTLDPSASRAMR